MQPHVEWGVGFFGCSIAVLEGNALELLESMRIGDLSDPPDTTRLLSIGRSFSGRLVNFVEDSLRSLRQ